MKEMETTDEDIEKLTAIFERVSRLLKREVRKDKFSVGDIVELSESFVTLGKKTETRNEYL